MTWMPFCIAPGLLLALAAPVAWAQPPRAATSPPPPSAPAAPQPPTPSQGGSPEASNAPASPAASPASNGPAQTLSVPAKNLMAQRLHTASFPNETEVRCSLLEYCAIGLTRGFVIGGDLLYGAAGTTLLGSQIYAPGAWVFYDGFLGYQFLQGVDGKYFANGSIGYRGFSYRKEVGLDDDERTIRSRGFTFRVNYGQEIAPTYTQGLDFQVFTGKTSMDEAGTIAQTGPEGQAQRKFARQFHSYSQSYPKVRLGLPADFELINWKASHVDLPNHMRGYVRAEPFYIQNEFIVEDHVESIEKNFGLRAMYLMSYESKQEKAGRYAFLAGVGFDLATSNKPEARYEADDTPDFLDADFKPRKTFIPLLNLEGSYQF